MCKIYCAQNNVIIVEWNRNPALVLNLIIFSLSCNGTCSPLCTYAFAIMWSTVLTVDLSRVFTVTSHDDENQKNIVFVCTGTSMWSGAQ